jgi:hypothetical protein
MPIGLYFPPLPYVLFTAPQELYRPAVEILCHRHSLAHLIGPAAVAKSAAQEGGVNEDFVRRHAGLIGSPQDRASGGLVAGPQVDASGVTAAVALPGSMRAWAR